MNDPRALARLSPAVLAIAAAAGLAGPAAADTDETAPTIKAALADAETAIRVYDEHLVTLASPFMEGRVPGSNGMEVAKDYVQFYIEAAGLEMPFTDERGNPSFRQAFPLGGTLKVADHEMTLGDHEFVGGEDFTATGMGASGEASGPVVFVGYSIDNGPEGYSSYAEDDELAGKIAVMLRFEPVGEDGASQWAGRGWSGRAAFANKLRAVSERDPAGVIIVNTPGTFDSRAESLITPDTSVGRGLDVPVFHMTTEAGERLVEALTGGDETLMTLRAHADEGGPIIDLGGDLGLAAELERTPLHAENVAGLLPGKGELAGELVVIGAHLDHLGMGFFGSRDRDRAGKVIHPGADDNASGSAAIIMLAERLAADYAALEGDADARSILFVLFSAEESGLNGSRYYVNNPIRDWEDHALMINFDMIGRIQENKLSVSGVSTAEGMEAWLAPIFERSSLEIIDRGPSGGGSDHLPFLQKNLPILFAICTPLHPDYHTPDDVSWKINRQGAVDTINLFHEILYAAATRDEPFVFADPSGGSSGQRGPRMGEIKVRFGISPGNYEGEEPGVLVSAVTEDGSAEKAGVQAGDRLMTWDGEEIGSIIAWMRMLADHEPGDEVEVGLVRDGEEMTLTVELQARPTSGG